MKSPIGTWTLVWTVVAVLIGGGLVVLGRQPGATPAPQRLPSYSLALGSMGMAGGGGSPYDLLVTDRVPANQAVAEVKRYLDRQGNSDLVLARLREFRWTYQAEIVERSTGRHAFGLMVRRATARISPKAGPNVFWNTKYGLLTGEIGGGYGMLGRLLPFDTGNKEKMAVTEHEARSVAERALKGVDARLSLDNATIIFYGFYEFQVAREGKLVGEVDVNGYSGQVWYKDWGEPQLSTQDLLASQQDAVPG